MRIDFLTDTYSPDINGAARTLRQMVDGVKSEGWEVRVIGPHADSSLAMMSFRVPKYSSVNVALLRSKTIEEFWSQIRPDVVYIATEAFLGAAGLKAARKMGIPVIAGYHTNFNQYAKSFKLGWLAQPAVRFLRKFHNKASATLVPSDSVKCELEGFGFEKLHVLGRGVDSERFHPSKRSDLLREKWGAKDGTPVAIFVARISPEKNLKLLSEAFQALQKKNPETVCVVVGDGPSFVGFQSNNPNVHCQRFLQGRELAEAYASADILVFPSLTETFGNTITEGLASGLVVVGFDYAAIQMHVCDGENGFCVPFGREEDFLRKCEKALDEVSNIDLRNAAVESVRDVTWDRVTQRFRKLCESLVERV
ncbi:glycosyltransferase family 4 protein [Rubritalea spongiae]|uniref:Glycosyltransferase family 4 protein n=1 Tax=Rubritalea spongiae TaxID=430797 RepID=A0ABW5E7F3_9BACT